MTGDVIELCHCGRPLHYTDPANEANVRQLVDEQGEFVNINVAGVGIWSVQRHYIALHGVKAQELPGLGFRQVAITCPKCGMTSHSQGDIDNRYCGNCHQFYEFM